jgi:hypothetical protein
LVPFLFGLATVSTIFAGPISTLLAATNLLRAGRKSDRGLAWISFYGLSCTDLWKLMKGGPFIVRRFAVVAGFSNALWLLVFGVNQQRWRAQAKAAGQ